MPFMAISYDAAGRRQSTTRRSSSTQYGYDGISRLQSLTQSFAGGSGNVTQGFGYNPASQITSQTRDNDSYAFTGLVNVDRPYAVNGLNQYNSAGAATFTYDANGNLITDGTRSYAYDAENRLVAANDTSLAYDPLGRLWRIAGPSVSTAQFSTTATSWRSNIMARAASSHATAGVPGPTSRSWPMLEGSSTARERSSFTPTGRARSSPAPPATAPDPRSTAMTNMASPPQPTQAGSVYRAGISERDRPLLLQGPHLLRLFRPVRQPSIAALQRHQTLVIEVLYDDDFFYIAKSGGDACL